jgi:hypothetical protein
LCTLFTYIEAVQRGTPYRADNGGYAEDDVNIPPSQRALASPTTHDERVGLMQAHKMPRGEADSDEARPNDRTLHPVHRRTRTR